MPTLRTALLSLVALVLVAVAPLVAIACPFCDPASKTFSEEIETMAVVAIVELVELAPPPPPGVYTAPELSRFRVVKFLKGEELLKSDTLETMYVGNAQPGDKFLLQGLEEGELLWSMPLPVNDRIVAYLETLPTLPAEGVERLLFFQDYLEDPDELLVRDAYNEFALASYEVIQEMAPHMDHDQLVEWIRDDGVPPSRRRLYLTMLGVCGSTADLPMLEEMLRSEELHIKAGLDAMIACYLTLGGSQGLPLIEDLFLKTHEAEMATVSTMFTGTPWQPLVSEVVWERAKPEYADTYSAIMALRFHFTDADVLEKEDILGSLRLMLDRPSLTDLVIPDLARAEDWSVMDRLFEIYRDADTESNWVRVPVVNYLRACPLPQAKVYLEQCEAIDPEAVRRANALFNPRGRPAASEPAANADEPDNSMIAGIDPALLAAEGTAEPGSQETAGEAASTAPAQSRGNFRLFALILGAVGVVLLILATMQRPATKQES